MFAYQLVTQKYTSVHLILLSITGKYLIYPQHELNDSNKYWVNDLFVVNIFHLIQSIKMLCKQISKISLPLLKSFRKYLNYCEHVTVELHSHNFPLYCLESLSNQMKNI